MNSPTEEPSAPSRWLLSLNCVIRLASPKPVEALQDPGQLQVLRHVALHEQRAAVGVDAEGEQLRGGDQRVAAQLRGVLVGSVMACRSTTQ